MSAQPGFLLDENINVAVAEGLELSELDVLHVRDLDLLSAPDNEIMERAIHLNRILVTRDIRDFRIISRILFDIGRSFPGILLVPPSIADKEPRVLVDAMLRWVQRYGSIDQIPGGISWLSPAELQDGDRRIKEPEPAYMRALQRIGATV